MWSSTSMDTGVDLAHDPCDRFSLVSTTFSPFPYSSRRGFVRKAMFALVVTCFFGDSSSLMQPQVQSWGGLQKHSPPKGLPLPLPSELLLGGVGTEKATDASISGTDTFVTLLESFRKVRSAVLEHLQNGGDFREARLMIVGMLDYIDDANEYIDDGNTEPVEGGGKTTTCSESLWQQVPQAERQAISETVDEALQVFYAQAFAAPYLGRSAWERVAMGIELLNLQLSLSQALESPCHTIPRSVLVRALTAITTLQERQQFTGISTWNDGSARNRFGSHVDVAVVANPDAAFRLLQRLVTGVGVRNRAKVNVENDSPRRRSATPAVLYEHDFNRVLNVYSNLGRMDMAHRVIALQERTQHAPSLSAVTYAILVKGYGKLGDWNNIDMILQHATASKIKPDTILFNSLIDAYINCNQLEKARRLFDAMVTRGDRLNTDVDDPEEGDLKNGGKSQGFKIVPEDCPAPNVRSYNIFLKGLARSGLWEEAKDLAHDMKVSFGWWDHVTTNTLVQAAVTAKAFGAALEILAEHTLDWSKTRNINSGVKNKRRNRGEHPNVDGYTTLMDGYAKSGQLEHALGLLSVMRDRNVEPNEYHYSCLIGGLARHTRTDQAQKLMAYVKENLRLPRHCQKVLYNALISGLINQDRIISGSLDHDRSVNLAIAAFREMIHEKVVPDINTVCVIVDGLGRCSRPRVQEANMLVSKLEAEGVIPKNNVKVCTALLRVFAASDNLDGATRCFQKIRDPDIAAINAFIDASVRCGHYEVAKDTFELFFGEHETQRIPDVITYSTLIGANLKKRSLEGSKTARVLYEEMKFRRRIFPDKALVDIIIKGMIETSKTCGLQASDARFVAGILRDASTMDWKDEQLEKRKMAIEALMRKHIARVWEEESELYGLRKGGTGNNVNDDMFVRHGWNRVDSGFRLWGAGMKAKPSVPADDFFQSKGWNNVDSGFRII